MKISVVILNYNVSFFLQQCILSVKKALQNIDSEIIVVDNHSQDDSCLMVKSRFPDVILIENTTNYGFPKGNNMGVALAKGDYICILNPDTVVAEDTFEKIYHFANSKANLGIVGCKLLDGTGHFLPESKREVPTPWVAFTKMAGLYKIFPHIQWFNQYYAGHLKDNQTGKVSILVGAFLFMKKELYEKVAGFDEQCFMYADDIDLSYRVLLEQKDNYYFHDTAIIHYKGESTIKDMTYMKRFQEAMLFFYKKHFKVNYIFNIFTTFAISFFAIYKTYFYQKKPLSKANHFIIVSQNRALIEKMSQKYQKKFQITSFENINNVISQLKDAEAVFEIVFDAHSIDFKSIIDFMNTPKSNKVFYKIIPPQSPFAIGSNSSSDRGEVIQF
ncbi:glycosyl transferase family 2 [Flavobacterium branchiophilum NBRC 15030 = ATCC 35035]|uniref:GT2 family glycosyltransferase n=1 Tax=Flavobacterium branchiophilum TaxID=55197 RepID=A0A543G6Q7_9FLAO|nr:glycosyltransferase family 2 protein [Flavobacterium branchiophilum]OXA81232.1 glycosyl transferase family 2 [Flavobacterium branchiophilum NBRC 15030 = ATCC 35035]TQM41765.1 GT2 family glycosyltransferase [Flavobacterium branchiophilum]